MTAIRSEVVFAMTTVDSWLVEIFIREQDRETHAEARLTKGAGGLTGQGTARRNPEDQEATEIGEEIAAARALSDLAHKLLDTAAGDIEAITHQRARLHL
jgi:Rv2632c-like